MSYSKSIIDDIFGGIRPAARALDKAATTIQGWYDAGTIPQKHWPDVMEAAKSFNHHLTPDDFFPSQAPSPSSFGYAFDKMHCLSIDDFHRPDIETLLSLGEYYLDLNVQKSPDRSVLKGKTLINVFFENSTRTEKSFELAGKRLGADVISMQIASSSVKKGETLLDTAATLNAMNPDILTVRHGSSGAPALLAQKVSCSVINAGDGIHEHPTQALLDALTLRQAFARDGGDGQIDGLRIAICGDILHSRVARSNVKLLNMLGAEVRLIGPPTLLPIDADRWGVDIFHDMKTGLKGCDVIMMLRLQLERMNGAFVPSKREYFHFHGLDRTKLGYAKDGALVMHPGPMNRGVEISSDIADDPEISLITQQVETGVAMRMGILHALSDVQDKAP
ncbi:aspartate carbamoyltransferase catalytic subunit [Hellea sp.]|nr:aspartate carbamoyltransferase catalytic subunit [Hellea sp.]